MNVVLLVVYNRPELFFFALEGILRARNASRYRYLVAAEYALSPEYIPLIKRLEKELGVEVVCRFANRPLGITRNILEGLKDASERTDEYTIILEDDLVVSGDYFDAIDAMYRQFHREDVLAFHCRSGRKRKDDPEPPAEQVLLVPEYQQPGVCISKEQFQRYFAQHCHPGYYDHKIGYLWKQFPQSTLKSNCPDVDGLAWRIMEKNKLLVAKTAAGRIHHIGFYGAHRELRDPSFLSLPYVQKVQYLNEVVWDSDKMRELTTKDWGDYWHVEEDHVWQRLELAPEQAIK